MKTITLAAIALAASAQASAFDLYGGFANRDNSVAYSPNPGVMAPLTSPVTTRVSLDQLVAGNPDSDRTAHLGVTPRATRTAPLDSSLALLTHGNPDSGTGVRLNSGSGAQPSVEVHDMIAAEMATDAGGV